MISLRITFLQRPDYHHFLASQGMAVPNTQLGLIVSAYQRSLQTISIPKLEDDEILIRNVAVSSNPKDWWFPLSTPGYACVEGNDIAGYIVALGREVDHNEFHVGDRVAALTKGFTGENRVYAISQFSAQGPSDKLRLNIARCICGIHRRNGGNDFPSWTKHVI